MKNRIADLIAVAAALLPLLACQASVYNQADLPPEPKKPAPADRPPPVEVSAEWWRSLKDPVVVDVVDEALGSVKDVHETATRVRAFVALWEDASSLMTPDVAGVTGKPAPRPHVLGILSWEKQILGQTGGLEPSPQGKRTLRQEAIRLSLSAQSVKAVLRAADTREQFQIARQMLEEARHCLDRARERRRDGIGSPLEVLKAKRAVGRADRYYQERRHLHDRAVRGLSTILGRYPGRNRLTEVELPPFPAAYFQSLPFDRMERRATWIRDCLALGPGVVILGEVDDILKAESAFAEIERAQADAIVAAKATRDRRQEQGAGCLACYEAAEALLLAKSLLLAIRRERLENLVNLMATVGLFVLHDVPLTLQTSSSDRFPRR